LAVLGHGGEMTWRRRVSLAPGGREAVSPGGPPPVPTPPPPLFQPPRGGRARPPGGPAAPPRAIFLVGVFSSGGLPAAPLPPPAAPARPPLLFPTAAAIFRAGGERT